MFFCSNIPENEFNKLEKVDKKTDFDDLNLFRIDPLIDYKPKFKYRPRQPKPMTWKDTFKVIGILGGGLVIFIGPYIFPYIYDSIYPRLRHFAMNRCISSVNNPSDIEGAKKVFNCMKNPFQLPFSKPVELTCDSVRNFYRDSKSAFSQRIFSVVNQAYRTLKNHVCIPKNFSKFECIEFVGYPTTLEGANKIYECIYKRPFHPNMELECFWMKDRFRGLESDLKHNTFSTRYPLEDKEKVLKNIRSARAILTKKYCKVDPIIECIESIGYPKNIGEAKRIFSCFGQKDFSCSRINGLYHRSGEVLTQKVKTIFSRAFKLLKGEYCVSGKKTSLDCSQIERPKDKDSAIKAFACIQKMVNPSKKLSFVDCRNVKKTYRRLSLQTHSDKQSKWSHFQKILNPSYEILEKNYC